MTTRAGSVGLLTGLVVTLILVYPLAIDWHASFTLWMWIAILAASVVTIGGGALAGKWSRSVNPVRFVLLGGLAGGLTGAIVFCLLGAAYAGLRVSVSSRIDAIATVVGQTQITFLGIFLTGIVLGSLGGWLARTRSGDQMDSFDKSDPQMAMNIAITALPASIVAGALSAFVFSRLATSVDESSILDMSLTVSLLLVFLSHLALTLLLPHEAQQAKHLCGMNEVKMTAFVGIGATPIFALLLFLVDPRLFLKLQVILALLASVLMSLRSLQVLVKRILPGRALLPAPQNDREQIEATWFGTIAESHGPRLIALCTGCGLAMILPLHVTVVSVLINLSIGLSPFAPARKPFLTQALTSVGLAGASIGILSAIYLFYLNLGRWFRGRILRPSKSR